MVEAFRVSCITCRQKRRIQLNRHRKGSNDHDVSGSSQFRATTVILEHYILRVPRLELMHDVSSAGDTWQMLQSSTCNRIGILAAKWNVQVSVPVFDHPKYDENDWRRMELDSKELWRMDQKLEPLELMNTHGILSLPLLDLLRYPVATSSYWSKISTRSSQNSAKVFDRYTS